MQLPNIVEPVGPSPIGGMLVDMAKRKQERDQFAAKNLLEQQRNSLEQQRMSAENERATAENRRADAQEKRYQTQYDKQQREDQNAALPQINSLLATDPQQAQSLGAVHGYTGFQQVQPQLPPIAGPQPQAPQAPSFVGPVQPPEQARTTALNNYAAENFQGLSQGQGIDQMRQTGQRAADQSTRALAEREQYEKDLLAHPEQMRQWSARVDAYKDAKQQAQDNPTWTAQGPNGPVTFQPNQARNEMFTRGNAYADTLKDDPVRAQRVRELSGMVKGGFLAPEKFATILEQELGRDSKNANAAAANQTKEDVAAMRQKKGGGKGGGMQPGGKQYQAEEKSLAAELKDYDRQRQLGGKGGMGEHVRDLSDALDEAQKPDQNGVTQLKILDKMIRAATGLGVRNQTLSTYMSHMSGLAGQGENKVQQWINGTEGTTAWNNVIQSLRSDLSDQLRRAQAENQNYWNVNGQSAKWQRHPDLIRRHEREVFGGMPGYGQAAHPSQSQPGETKVIGGKTYVKVGPNNWQPQ